MTELPEKPKLEGIKLSSEAAANLRFKPCSPVFDKICIPDIAQDKICVPNVELEPIPYPSPCMPIAELPPTICKPAFRILPPEICDPVFCKPNIIITAVPVGTGCSVCHVCREPPTDIGGFDIDPDDFRKVLAENEILKAQNIALEKRVTALENRITNK